MSRMRVPVLLAFLAVAVPALAERPPGDRAKLRTALRRCRADERACRRRCQAEPNRRARRVCRRECQRTGRNCRRLARGKRPIRWVELARCRGERRQCAIACGKKHSRIADRRACTLSCNRGYLACTRAARRGQR